MNRLRTDGGVLCFGETMVRLSAPGAELLLQTPRLDVCFGGAEANVAVSLAHLGHAAGVITTFPDNALGYAARNELRRFGVDTRHVRFGPGRMGLYFLSPGAGGRAGEIIYDRAGSAFAMAEYAHDDWRSLLNGAGWLHLSGVTAALGAHVAEAAIAAASTARQRGLTVSFDCNYRAKLWQAWDGDAPAILRRIIDHTDVLFGGARDIALVLSDAPSPAQEAAAQAFAAFPSLQLISATARAQHSVNHHTLSASLHTRDGSCETPACDMTDIVDRIGAGDAFAAGLIHALRSGMPHDAALRFALGAACLKHTIPGDFNLAGAGDVEAFLAADLNVRR
ncbi:MAG: PfkB family carbohydrate kinase [Hyphomonadaceae bacterium]